MFLCFSLFLIETQHAFISEADVFSITDDDVIQYTNS